MADANFETLISRTNKKLQRLEQKSDDPLAGAKISALREELQELERHGSSEPQIRAYGAERWHEDFVRLADISTLPSSHPQSRRLPPSRLKKRVIEELGNIPFMRFQRAFSSARDLIVPQFEVQADGQIKFPAIDKYRLSVQGCIVNPERIPEKLAEDLGLADFKEDLGNPKARLMKLASPILIERLKEIWDSSVPLSYPDRSYRVLLLREKDLPRDSREKLSGSLLITRQRSRKQGQSESEIPDLLKPLSVQFFSDVYSAKRRLVHNANSYSSEIGLLSEIEEGVKSLAARIRRDWKHGGEEVHALLREESEELLSEYGELLRRSNNIYKEEAARFIKDAASLRDGTGRINPLATVTRLNAGINRIEERLREARRKDSFTQKDRRILEQHIGRAEGAFAGARHRLGRGGKFRASTLNRRSLRIFSSSSLSGEPLAKAVRSTLAMLGIHRDDFSRIDTSPFKELATVMRSQITACEQALFRKSRIEAKNALNGMQIVLKINAVVVGIEHLKEAAGLGEEVPVSKLRDLSRTIGAVLDEDPYFPLKETPLRRQINSGLKALRAEVRRMSKALSDYAEAELKTEDREQMNSRFRDFLDGLDYQPLLKILQKPRQQSPSGS